MSVTNQICNNIIDRSRCQNTNPPTAHRKIYQCHSIKHMYQNTNPIIAHSSIYLSQWMKQVSKHEPHPPFNYQCQKELWTNNRMVDTAYDIRSIFRVWNGRGSWAFRLYRFPLKKYTSILSIVYCFKFYNIWNFQVDVCLIRWSPGLLK